MAQKRIQIVGNYAVVRGTADALTSGTLVVGATYIIDTVLATDDFTNVGFVSVGVEFVATGTTPTVWTNSTEVHEIIERFEAPKRLTYFTWGGGRVRVFVLDPELVQKTLNYVQHAPEAEWVDEDGAALTGGWLTWLRTNLGA